ncbi:PREDICTED: uncharacterized protein LOC108364045 [Rhagoletis zephyria]|uniref:uncharacterized protein LOC108364045 n=1 Tax=Rhagoletis zephyria TaxID=28612 RepID=UPI0008118859|nr:PREDICTED: uncharacterized protein LOC108364045 [Rhagoletis zephyria]
MSYRGRSYTNFGLLTRLCFMLALALIFQLNGIHGIPFFPKPIDCGPPNVYPELCVHGNFSVNFNPEFCLARTICYKGLGESCQQYGEASDCKPGLYCSCDRCSRKLTLCGSNVPKLSPWAEFAKRMQPNLQEYGF